MIKSLLLKPLITIKRLLIPKIKLSGSTIIISRSAWKKFDSSLFNYNNVEFLVVDSLSQLSPTAYKHVIAYIGGGRVKNLTKFSNLRWVQIPSHGYNGFEYRNIYANDNVVVTNLKSIYSKPIAEFCITGFYIFHSYAFRRRIAEEITLYNLPRLKENISVLIYGFGNIGQEIGCACERQGWKVYGVKRDLREVNIQSKAQIIGLEEADKYLSQCDYVINVLPETSETKNIFNASFFSKMQSNAIFCNVGRGSAVVDADLEKAVKNKVIAGAILDACNSYKYSDPNIIRTYHASSFSVENDDRLNAFFSEQLHIFLKDGEDALNNKISLI